MPTNDRDKTRIYWFAIMLVMLSFCYFFGITFFTLPESAGSYVDVILGFLLGTAVGTVVNFFFGSSKGSHDKSTFLAENLAEKDEREKCQGDKE